MNADGGFTQNVHSFKTSKKKSLPQISLCVCEHIFFNNLCLIKGLVKWIKQSSKRELTSGVVEGGSSGFAPFPAVALVKGEALVPSSCNHLHIPDRVSRLTQGLQPVHFPTAGVGQVESLVHGVHRQVVLVSRTRAGDRKKRTNLKQQQEAVA